MKAELIPLRPGISKSQMRRATDSAHLRVEYCADAFREVSMKLACIGYFIRPRHRPEFLRVLRFIETDLPMTLEAARCMSVCLDILRERFEA
jgi:hypothetical protein